MNEIIIVSDNDEHDKQFYDLIQRVFDDCVIRIVSRKDSQNKEKTNNEDSYAEHSNDKRIGTLLQ